MKKQITNICAAAISAVALASSIALPTFAASGDYDFIAEHDDVTWCSANSNSSSNTAIKYNLSESSYNGTSATIKLEYCYVGGNNQTVTPVMKVVKNTTGTPISVLIANGKMPSNVDFNSINTDSGVSVRIADITGDMNSGQSYRNEYVPMEVSGLREDSEYFIYTVLKFSTADGGSGTGGSANITQPIAMAIARKTSISTPPIDHAEINEYKLRSNNRVVFDYTSRGRHYEYNQLRVSYSEGSSYRPDNNKSITPTSVDINSKRSSYDISGLKPNTNYVMLIKYINKDGNTVLEEDVRFSTANSAAKTPKISVNDNNSLVIEYKDEELDGTNVTGAHVTLRKNNDADAREANLTVPSNKVVDGKKIDLNLNDGISLDPNSEYTATISIDRTGTGSNTGATDEATVVFATDGNGKPSRIISAKGLDDVDGDETEGTESDAKKVKNPNTLDPIVISVALLAVAGAASFVFVKTGKFSRR